MERIAAIPGVAAVYESQEYKRPEVQPQMISSKELVQAQLAWDKYDFKGEGMVVGVIDSGIDPNHQDFVLSDNETGEITKAEVDAALASGEVEKGKYFTAKVPFGYNYMDDNYEVRDIGPGASMHGQHVSGTVGANGNEETGGIKGVAPEAQILALKVFGNDDRIVVVLRWAPDPLRSALYSGDPRNRTSWQIMRRTITDMMKGSKHTKTRKTPSTSSTATSFGSAGGNPSKLA